MLYEQENLQSSVFITFLLFSFFFPFSFRKYSKIVQLVIGPSFGYSESFTGEDGKESLNPLNTGQRDDPSDR